MAGEGSYVWVDLDGKLCRGGHWDELPDEMERLVAFEPAFPEPPHTEEDHAFMDSLHDKFRQVLGRCRR